MPKWRVGRLAEIGRAVLDLRLPFTSAELRTVFRFDRLDILLAVPPDAKREAMTFQFLLAGIEIRRHQIAIAPLTNLATGNPRVRQCSQLASGYAEFQFHFDGHAFLHRVLVAISQSRAVNCFVRDVASMAAGVSSRLRPAARDTCGPRVQLESFPQVRLDYKAAGLPKSRSGIS